MCPPASPEPVNHGPAFDPNAAPLLPPQAFLDALTGLGVTCEPAELGQFGRYLRFLKDANDHLNLTAVSEPGEMWTRHVADSLSLVPVIASLMEEADAAAGGESSSEAEGEGEDEAALHAGHPKGAAWRLIDVGSGGGLPGIPLAIALPDVECTLLEATGKKARFLEAVVEALGLPNVRVVQARAEEAGRDRLAHREQYDFVTSRAVGPLATLVELTVPFARVQGVVLAIKGERAAEEVAEAKQALYALHAHALDLIRAPTGTLVPIRKMRMTPKIYPRRPGEPKRVPLGVTRPPAEKPSKSAPSREPQGRQGKSPRGPRTDRQHDGSGAGAKPSGNRSAPRNSSEQGRGGAPTSKRDAGRGDSGRRRS